MFTKALANATWAPTAARVFLALLFVVGGYGKLTGFDATVGYIGMLTNESVAPLLTVLAIIFELGGGLMLLLNWKTELAVDMLIAFTILATILGHSTFTGDAMQDRMQMTAILKNLAIIGGLLLMGRYAVESQKESAPATV